MEITQDHVLNVQQQKMKATVIYTKNNARNVHCMPIGKKIKKERMIQNCPFH